jgi:hypothetical protein
VQVEICIRMLQQTCDGGIAPLILCFRRVGDGLFNRRGNNPR